MCGLSVRCVPPPSPLCAVSRELGSVDEILGPLTEILEGVLQADQQLMEKTKAKVFSAFITVLQMKEMSGEGREGVRGKPSSMSELGLFSEARVFSRGLSSSGKLFVSSPPTG